MSDTPSRAYLAERAAWWKAVAEQAAARAAAAQGQLEDQARAEHTEQGIAPTWRIPGIGTASLAICQDSVSVVDPAAYAKYVEVRYPTEVTTTTVVNPAFDRLLRARLAKSGAVCDREGSVVPGLQFVPGGRPKHLSLVVPADVKEILAELAGAFLDAASSATSVEDGGKADG